MGNDCSANCCQKEKEKEIRLSTNENYLGQYQVTPKE